MDEEELYNKLSTRIREVFDHYDEEDTAAADGWALLRQKFPEEEKRRGLAWLWYAAAAIVLLCLGIWFIYQPADTKKLVVKNTAPVILNGRKEKPRADSGTIKTALVTDALAQNKTNQPANGAAPTVTNGQPSNPLTQVITAKPASSGQTNGAGTSPANAIAAVKQAPQNPLSVNSGQPKNAVTGNSGADSIMNKINAGALAGNKPQTKKPDSVLNNTAAYTAANKPAEQAKPTSAEALAKLLSEKTPADQRNDKSKGANKKAVLNVFAATYFNYAKGSDNKINVGAGFGSDFRLSNKLKLSTGLSLAQNSLNYTGGAPVYSGTDGRAAAAAASDPASAALTQAAYNSSQRAGLVSALTPVLKNYTASLIGLDIPINLKYQFNPQKNDTYISAGLSSGTFINETYVLNYTAAQLDQKSTTHTSFNNFDFAKTLNVSFGVGYPLGKSNRLIIEPFLKYPLDGLGSQQIKFGAGGINLKLNFIPLKK